MKNKILILFVFVLISITANAWNYFPVKLIYRDGKEQIGYAKLVIIHTMSCVVFKTAKGAKKQRIPSNSLKTIIYYYSNYDGYKYGIQYDRMRVYRWGDNKLSKYFLWLKVIKRDYITMYYYNMPTPSSPVNMPVHVLDMYFHRTGEDGATLVFSGIRRYSSYSVLESPIFSTQKYRPRGLTKYFNDYPELSAKIIKRKRYTWDEIEQIVEMYNRMVLKNR